ncbi:MAG: AAA family ATPase [Pirellula sp.]
MQFTIAAIVTTKRIEGETRYCVQTLGDFRLTATDVLLKTALQRLAQVARKQLQTWIERGRAQQISNWLFNPEDVVSLFKEHLTLRTRTLTCKTLLCERSTPSGSYVFVPLIANLHYQRIPSVPFRAQATEVLTQWCNEQLKEDSHASLDELVLTGDAWIEPLDIGLTMIAAKKKKKGKQGALLGQSNPGGAEALERIGRCLDFHIDKRPTLVGRDSLADRLHRLIDTRRRQSVLLIGPASVGKTAILEEVVRRRVAARKPKSRHRKQTWLVSPSRVISGMSYLGQWEERWLAILKEAYRRDHVLYFDDPIGLYAAGKTRDSDLCLADVLKAFVSEHPVRLVFELTHGELSVLRRRDRSLVDNLVPLAIEPMDESATLRTLVQVVTEIEASKGCYFHPGLLPKFIDYGAITSPHQSLPGKAIALAHGLVSHATKKPIEDSSHGIDDNLHGTRPVRSVGGTDLDQFVEQRTGLRLDLRRKSFSLDSLRELLGRMLFGQPRAVDVLSRYAMRSIKGLQSMDRPLGVFLFLGPTGVGKTESAKALTRLLFLDESRMVRIDMNEITSAQAAEELIGTLEHPDGRLPSALRRQPNCVLLLDEIEKAHPDVFDYLLQVIGEGRLSDARGRLVDFRNSFIIMTSNLGSMEQRNAMGYESESSMEESHWDAVYRRAAQQFFRPEFLNRIDEFVVFHRLNRRDMSGVVNRHLDGLMQRDGLLRRRVFLHVDDTASEWIIDRGYDPNLGARAIQRAIEQHVTQPLADQMAASKVDSSVWTRLRVANGSLQCVASELRDIPLGTVEPDAPIDACIAQSRQRLDCVRNRLSVRSPSNQHAIDPLSQFDYYAVHNVLAESEEMLRDIKDWRQDALAPNITPIHSTIKSTPSKIIANSNHRYVDTRKNARRDDIATLKLRESIAESSQGLVGVSSKARQLLRQVRLAELVMDCIDDPKSWIFQATFLNPPKSDRPLDTYWKGGLMDRSVTSLPKDLNGWCAEMFANFGYSVRLPHDRSFVAIDGASARCLIEPLLGTYQVSSQFGTDQLLLIQAKPIAVNTLRPDFSASTEALVGDDFLTCQTEVRSMRSAQGDPIDTYCGPLGWMTIRGAIQERWQDYRTGASVAFPYSREWDGWLLDQQLQTPNLVLTP